MMEDTIENEETMESKDFGDVQKKIKTQNTSDIAKQQLPDKLETSDEQPTDKEPGMDGMIVEETSHSELGMTKECEDEESRMCYINDKKQSEKELATTGTNKERHAEIVSETKSIETSGVELGSDKDLKDKGSETEKTSAKEQTTTHTDEFTDKDSCVEGMADIDHTGNASGTEVTTIQEPLEKQPRPEVSSDIELEDGVSATNDTNDTETLMIEGLTNKVFTYQIEHLNKQPGQDSAKNNEYSGIKIGLSRIHDETDREPRKEISNTKKQSGDKFNTTVTNDKEVMSGDDVGTKSISDGDLSDSEAKTDVGYVDTKSKTVAISDEQHADKQLKTTKPNEERLADKCSGTEGSNIKEATIKVFGADKKQKDKGLETEITTSKEQLVTNYEELAAKGIGVEGSGDKIQTSNEFGMETTNKSESLDLESGMKGSDVIKSEYTNVSSTESTNDKEALNEESASQIINENKLSDIESLKTDTTVKAQGDTESYPDGKSNEKKNDKELKKTETKTEIQAYRDPRTDGLNNQVSSCNDSEMERLEAKGGTDKIWKTENRDDREATNTRTGTTITGGKERLEDKEYDACNEAISEKEPKDIDPGMKVTNLIRSEDKDPSTNGINDEETLGEETAVRFISAEHSLDQGLIKTDTTVQEQVDTEATDTRVETTVKLGQKQLDKEKKEHNEPDACKEAISKKESKEKDPGMKVTNFIHSEDKDSSANSRNVEETLEEEAALRFINAEHSSDQGLIETDTTVQEQVDTEATDTRVETTVKFGQELLDKEKKEHNEPDACNEAISKREPKEKDPGMKVTNLIHSEDKDSSTNSTNDEETLEEEAALRFINAEHSSDQGLIKTDITVKEEVDTEAIDTRVETTFKLVQELLDKEKKEHNEPDACNEAISKKEPIEKDPGMKVTNLIHSEDKDSSTNSTNDDETLEEEAALRFINAEHSSDQGLIKTDTSVKEQVVTEATDTREETKVKLGQELLDKETKEHNEPDACNEAISKKEPKEKDPGMKVTNLIHSEDKDSSTSDTNDEETFEEEAALRFINADHSSDQVLIKTDTSVKEQVDTDETNTRVKLGQKRLDKEKKEEPDACNEAISKNEPIEKDPGMKGTNLIHSEDKDSSTNSTNDDETLEEEAALRLINAEHSSDQGLIKTDTSVKEQVVTEATDTREETKVKLGQELLDKETKEHNEPDACNEAISKREPTEKDPGMKVTNLIHSEDKDSSTNSTNDEETLEEEAALRFINAEHSSDQGLIKTDTSVKEQVVTEATDTREETKVKLGQELLDKETKEHNEPDACKEAISKKESKEKDPGMKVTNFIHSEDKDSSANSTNVEETLEEEAALRFINAEHSSDQGLIETDTTVQEQVDTEATDTRVETTVKFGQELLDKEKKEHNEPDACNEAISKREPKEKDPGMKVTNLIHSEDKDSSTNSTNDEETLEEEAALRFINAEHSSDQGLIKTDITVKEEIDTEAIDTRVETTVKLVQELLDKEKKEHNEPDACNEAISKKEPIEKDPGMKVTNLIHSEDKDSSTNSTNDDETLEEEAALRFINAEHSSDQGLIKTDTSVKEQVVTEATDTREETKVKLGQELLDKETKEHNEPDACNEAISKKEPKEKDPGMKVTNLIHSEDKDSSTSDTNDEETFEEEAALRFINAEHSSDQVLIKTDTSVKEQVDTDETNTRVKLGQKRLDKEKKEEPDSRNAAISNKEPNEKDPGMKITNLIHSEDKGSSTNSTNDEETLDKEAALRYKSKNQSINVKINQLELQNENNLREILDLKYVNEKLIIDKLRLEDSVITTQSINEDFERKITECERERESTKSMLEKEALDILVTTKEEELTVTAKRLDSALERCEDITKQHHREILQINSEKVKLCEQNKELNCENNKLKKNVSELELNVIQLGNKLVEQENEKIRLTEQYQFMADSNRNIETQLINSKQELSRLQSKIDSYNPSLDRVLENETKLLTAWDLLINEQTASREERLEVEKRRHEINEMQSNVEKKEREIDKVKTDMMQKEDEIKACIESLETSEAVLQTELENAQERLAYANDELAKYKSSWVVLEGKNSTLQSSLQIAERTLNGKEEELSKIKGDYEQEKSNVRILKEIQLQQSNQLLKERETVEQLKDTERSNARRILDQGDVIQDLHRQIQDASENIAKLDSEKQELCNEWTTKYRLKSAEFELESNKYQKLLEEKTRLQDCMRLQGVEIKKLQDTQKVTEKTIQDITREKRQKEDEVKRTSDQVQALSKSFRELTERSNAEKEKYLCVKGLLQQKTLEKETSDVQLVSASSDLRVLQAEIAAKDQRIQQLFGEKEQLRARFDLGTVASLEQKLQECCQRNQNLQDELKKASDGYQQLMAMTGDRSTENERLKKENNRLARESRCCKERVAVLLTTIRTLEEQNRNLRVDLNDSYSF